MTHLAKIAFRYMDERWVDQFLQNGSIRLTTLKRCREIECDTRNDTTEGQYHFVTKLDGVKRDASKAWLPQFTNEAGEVIDGVGYAILYYSINCFLLCLSTECSIGMRNRFGTDSCLSINDLEGFYQALSEEVRKQIPLCEDGYGLCLYADQNPVNAESILLSIDQAPFSINCTKPSKYKDDREVRIIWVPYPEDKVVYKKIIRARKYGYQFKESEVQLKYSVAVSALPNQIIEQYDYLDIVCPEAIQFCEKCKS